MSDTPAVVSPANPEQTPAERLKALKGELQKEEDQLSELTRSRDARKNDVDTLTKIVDEIDKSKTAYEKSLKDLNDEKQKLDTYEKKLAPMLDGVLGAKKADVDAAIEGVRERIKGKRTEVETAKSTADQAAKDAQAAQSDLDTKQLDYDGYKNLQKSLGEKIKKMQGFKSTIDKYDDAKPASMYVYLRELQSELNDTVIPSNTQFETELNTRWKKLDQSRETVRDKKWVAESANGKLATEQANLAALEKSRVDDLLKATDAFNELSKPE